MLFNQCEPRKTHCRTGCCQNLPFPHNAPYSLQPWGLIKVFLPDASAYWTEFVSFSPCAFRWDMGTSVDEREAAGVSIISL